MKVLLINGSAHKEGCTYTALCEVAKALNINGIDTEIFQVGNPEIRDCCGCMECTKLDGKCVFDDIVNELIAKAADFDGFVFGSPVYFAHPSGRLLSLMDRAFYAGKKNFAFKPASVVVSARRAGTTASLDVIMKHFTIANMPVISSSYWNMVHGSTPDQVKQDLEGMQIMRHLGENMAWVLKCIDIAQKTGLSHPEQDAKIKTNFIR